jgi:surface antigen
VTPRRLVAGGCALASLAMSSGSASAQWRNLFPEGFSATKEDMDRQRAATRSLLRTEPPPVGQSESWSNPKSGAHGTVTMLGASQRRGLPCREMRYTITTARAVSPLEVNFTVCRMPDGAWKLAG